MKRCPECRRDYYDETLLYCLDDGTRLLDGPAGRQSDTVILPASEAPTRVLGSESLADDPTPTVSGKREPRFGLRTWKAKVVIAGLAILASLGIAAYYYGSFETAKSEPIPAGVSEGKPKLYWEMPEAEQMEFIAERARYVQTLIGDQPDNFDDDARRAIKREIDYYVEKRDSLSQKPFEEGLRVIYGRASQYAPLVAQAFELHKVPAALGVYQAMIESEYRDCPTHEHPKGPVGLFQFSRRTAASYDLKPEDYCDVNKQSDAAARHMSDLISDFGTERSSWTLALLSFNIGGDGVREYLRQMRSRGVTERNFWALLRDRRNADPARNDGLDYVPRFFAAAIIGESPAAFDLSTPPLTTLR